MKTHFNISLAIVASVAILGASFADIHKATPTKLPANIGRKVIKVQVGTDHIGHVVDNYSVVRSQASIGPNMLYDTAGFGNGYYYPTGPTKETIESVPLGGASAINGMAFTFYKGDAGTFNANVNFYDLSASNGNDIYENACAAVGGGGVGFTIVGLTGDPSFAFIVPVLFTAPVCAPGDIAIGVNFDTDSTAGASSPGELISGVESAYGGTSMGVGANNLDVYTAFGGFSEAGYRSSPGDSDNYWTEYDNVALTNTCYYWGGNPMANWMLQVYGNYSIQVALSGDYSFLGPEAATPDNYVFVKVTGGAADYETVSRVTVASDDVTGGGLGLAVGTFTLPFDPSTATGTRDIYVHGFRGYANACVLGATIADTAFLCECNEYDLGLLGGDCTGDNTINILDLNAVLINFGLTGCVIP